MPKASRKNNNNLRGRKPSPKQQKKALTELAASDPDTVIKLAKKLELERKTQAADGKNSHSQWCHRCLTHKFRKKKESKRRKGEDR